MRLDRLVDCRKMRGLTQNDTAKYLKVSIQAISKYENGLVANIPLAHIEAMATLYSVSPAYLVGWDEWNGPTQHDEFIDYIISKSATMSFEQKKAIMDVIRYFRA